MAIYLIPEENITKFEKQIAKIEKLSKKYDSPFHYEDLGEFYQGIENEECRMEYIKMHKVDVEGYIKHDNWAFVATLNHTPEGNIIRTTCSVVDDLILDKYQDCQPICDHCNTNRARKNTYIIWNTVTKELKQVGTNCLEEYTCGLSAEAAANWAQFLVRVDELANDYSLSTIRTRYYKVEDVLLVAKKLIDKDGYMKSEEGETSTKVQTFEHFGDADIRESITKDDCNFVLDAIEWILKEEGNNTYIHNLQTLIKNKYCSSSDFGYVVSLIPTYGKHLAEEKRKQELDEKNKNEAEASSYIGEVGDKVDVEVVSCECVSERDTMYGPSYLWKFVDNNGNVLMWSSGNWVNDRENVVSVKGTIKSLEEFRGVKQTWLTRCKVK